MFLLYSVRSLTPVVPRCFYKKLLENNKIKDLERHHVQRFIDHLMWAEKFGENTPRRIWM